MSRLEVITLETVFNLELSQRQSWTRLQPNSGLTNKSKQRAQERPMGTFDNDHLQP